MALARKSTSLHADAAEAPTAAIAENKREEGWPRFMTEASSANSDAAVTQAPAVMMTTKRMTTGCLSRAKERLGNEGEDRRQSREALLQCWVQQRYRHVCKSKVHHREHANGDKCGQSDDSGWKHAGFIVKES